MIREILRNIISSEIQRKETKGDFTLSGLATKSGINKAQVSRFLKTGGGISDKALEGLAEALGLRLDFNHQVALPLSMDPQWIEQIALRLRNRQAVLLVGSGLSRIALPREPEQSSPMPLWKDLIQELCLLVDENNDEWKEAPFELLDYFCEEKRDENQLREEVARLTDDSAFLPSQIHRKLVSLPWDTIITTNYDHLLERACEDRGSRCQPVIEEKDLTQVDQGRAVPILKIHGDRTHPAGMVILRKDYEDWFARHPVWASKLMSLFVEKQWVIIGVSLSDPNWQYLYTWIKEQTGRLHKKPVILAHRPGKGQVKAYEKQGLRVIGYSYQEELEGLLTLLGSLLTEIEVARVSAAKAHPLQSLPDWFDRYKSAMESRYSFFDLTGLYWAGPAYARTDIRMEEIYQPPRISLRVPGRRLDEVRISDLAGRFDRQDAQPARRGESPAKKVRVSLTLVNRIESDGVDADGREAVQDLNLLSEYGLKGTEHEFLPPEQALDALPRYRALVLLGDPGSGKSLLLKRSLLLAMQTGDNPLPVFLPLRQWAEELAKNNRLGLEEFAGYFLSQQVDISPKEFRDFFEAGQVWWFLDGLDEVRHDATGWSGVRFILLDHLNNALQRRTGDRFTVTSRPAGYRLAPLRNPWQEASLLPFNDEESLDFFARWFSLIRRKEYQDLGSHQVIYENAKAHPGLKDLLTNPLLLTLMVLFYKSGRRLPDNRREFYRYSFDSLGDRWLAAKRLISGKDFPRRDILDPVLARIGYGIQRLGIGRGLASREYMSTWAREAMVEMGLSGREIENELNLFLSVASSLIGIVVEQAPGYYGFMHLTFQEYAATLYLSRHPGTARREMRFLTHPQWEETWRLFFQEISPVRETGTEFLRFLLEIDGHGLDKVLHRPLIWAILAVSEGVVSGDMEERIKASLEAILCDSQSSPPTVARLLSALAQCPRMVERVGKQILLERFGDKDWIVRFGGAKALGSAAFAPEVRNALLKRLDDKDRYVREAAAKVLVPVASVPEVRDALLKRLEDEEESVRRAAGKALGSAAFAPEVRNALLKRLDDKDGYVREAAAVALGSVASVPEVRGALLKRLDDKVEKVREAAAVALGSAAFAPEVRNALLKGLEDEAESVRFAATEALGSVASVPEVRDALLDKLDDKDGDVREAAADALASVASAPEVRDALLKMLDDKDGDVREAAADALASVASAPEVRDALLKMLDDKEWIVRSAAAHALSAIASAPQVRDAILKRLDGKDGDVRRAAAHALGSVASVPEVRDALLKRLEDEEESVRFAATEALGSVASVPEVRDALLKRLEDEEESVRFAATEALGSVASVPEVRDALLKRLEDEEEGVQHNAWSALYPLPVDAG